MSENKKQHEEEVDLGSLFIIIGKGFSNFFNFIGSLFKGLYHLFILFLLFIKKHSVKFIVSMLIGGGVGYFLESEKEIVYASEMVVSPNFDSAQSLYVNISFINALIKEGDSLALSSLLNLSTTEVLKLKAIKIEPQKNARDIAEKYDEMVKELDTLVTSNFRFPDFRDSFTTLDYKQHMVFVEATDKFIFSKMEASLLGTINNEYYKNVKKGSDENLERTDSLLRGELSQIDTLRRVYNNVLVEQSKKDFQGTKIDLGDSKESTRELELFQNSKRINRDLNDVIQDRSLKSNIINVIASFSPVGYKVTGIERNMVYIGTLFSLVVVLMLILLIELNKYLNNYKK